MISTCLDLILLVFLLLIQNITHLKDDIAPSWVPEPDGRGTWSVLYGCVFTIWMCVFTAVHLNIPGADEGRWMDYARQAKWTCLAILSPDIVAVLAFDEFRAAFKLWRALNWYSKSIHALRTERRDIEVRLQRKRFSSSVDVESQNSVGRSRVGCSHLVLVK